MKSRIAVFSFAAAALSASAALVPVSPKDDAIVPLLPDAQKRILALPTKEARNEALEPERHHATRTEPKPWRQPLPLVLSWQATAKEKGPWKVRISRNEDLSDGVDFLLESSNVKSAVGECATVWTCEPPRVNLETGRKYWWSVYSGDEASVASGFVTEDTAPRWILVEGRVKNIRDLGGWKTSSGGRVRQGLVFRGQGLNDNSVDGKTPGRNRLYIEDAKYMKESLGIKTDLDLRSQGETAGMKVSPLGGDVRFISRSSPAYNGIFGRREMDVMAQNFRVFCDRSNYPVYFHCIAGADRTGALAYVLNGLLGVDKEDLERDWESTFYPKLPGVKDKSEWRGSHYFDEGFAKYGGESVPLAKRIELYLIDCGVTAEEIARFREIMLAPAD